MGQQAAQQLGRGRLEGVFGAPGGRLEIAGGARAREIGLQLLQAAHRQQRPDLGLLGQGVDIIGEDDVHRVDLTAEEELLRELGDRPGLGELGRILVGELRDQVPLQARHPLGGLATGHDVRGVRRRGLRGLAQEVGVERAAEALVGADDDQRPLPHLAPFGERVLEIAGAGRRRRQDLVHEGGIGSARQRGLLGLAHLGRGDHLHRLGDLGRVLDRLDAAPDVACAGHGVLGRLPVGRGLSGSSA